MGFLKNYLKKKAIQQKIEKYRIKAELSKYKTLSEVNKNRAKSSRLSGFAKELERTDELRQIVAETNPKHPLIQLLENPTVQDLIRAGIQKFMMGKVKIEGDDQLIDLYRELPADIKEKVKNFAIGYIGKN